MPIQTSQHQWKQMIVTPVILIEAEGGFTAVPDPEGKEEVRYGCFVCNMGIEEGIQVGCPGFDLFDESHLA